MPLGSGDTRTLATEVRSVNGTVWVRHHTQSAAARAIGIAQSQLSKHLNRSHGSTLVPGVDPINGYLARVVGRVPAPPGSRPAAVARPQPAKPKGGGGGGASRRRAWPAACEQRRGRARARDVGVVVGQRCGRPRRARRRRGRRGRPQHARGDRAELGARAAARRARGDRARRGAREAPARRRRRQDLPRRSGARGAQARQGRAARRSGPARRPPVQDRRRSRRRARTPRDCRRATTPRAKTSTTRASCTSSRGRRRRRARRTTAPRPPTPRRTARRAATALSRPRRPRRCDALLYWPPRGRVRRRAAARSTPRSPRFMPRDMTPMLPRPRSPDGPFRAMRKRMSSAARRAATPRGSDCGCCRRAVRVARHPRQGTLLRRRGRARARARAKNFSGARARSAPPRTDAKRLARCVRERPARDHEHARRRRVFASLGHHRNARAGPHVLLRPIQTRARVRQPPRSATVSSSSTKTWNLGDEVPRDRAVRARRASRSPRARRCSTPRATRARAAAAALAVIAPSVPPLPSILPIAPARARSSAAG